MSRVEAEGQSIDEAIEKALAELGVPRERARVEILQDARKGLLGFGGQKARVVVSLRGGEPEDVSEAPPGSAGESRSPSAPPTKRPAPTATPPAAGPEPAGVLQAILTRMDFPASVKSDAPGESGEVVLRISSDASALLIGRHGQTLDALEYLVNRICGKPDERASRVLVDCEGYRERHERELRETASRMAAKVRSRGRPQTTIAMNPRDRRIVHLALANDRTIVTRSVGQGYLRRVVIAPARGGKAPAPPSDA